MSEVGSIKKLTGEPRLPEVLRHHYGLRVKAARPVEGILQLTTDRGIFGLKRVHDREEGRWKLVRELAEYISETGSPQIPSPVLTRRGAVTVAGHRRRYVLLPWIKGEVHDLRIGDRWSRAARTLARVHSVSKGFDPSRGLGSFVHTGKWERIWRDLGQQVSMFKLAADLSEETTPVDRLWLRQCTFTEGMLETALRYLEKLGGDSVVLETRKNGEACHCNPHRRNWVWDAAGIPHLIDWNRLVLDGRSRDLARFILYAYGRTGSLAPAEAILKAYQETAPLEEAEYGLIYAQLLFPHNLLRTLSNIYREQKIPSHLAKGHLSSTLDLEEKKEGLLRGFPALVTREFQVTIPRVDWLERSTDRS
ncbi:CotS family spore coat protein [Melghirimyces profundicolus]|uniref:CotS family spore coat protein n=1 Tax=Melghirimyces profundicolus TaxID=1242148 RepID=A0A2T6BSM4_9BACL|nr:phosphotransferase [Melghirimyces profundicolus]PTX59090.1 CotS family spore coat protein [Melghirimyces profundicolus]